MINICKEKKDIIVFMIQNRMPYNFLGMRKKPWKMKDMTEEIHSALCLKTKGKGSTESTTKIGKKRKSEHEF